MATRYPTVNDYDTYREVVWAGLLTGDDGGWLALSKWPDKTMEISGTFGTATLTLEGPAAGNVLEDQNGTNLSFTSASTELSKAIVQNPSQMRPKNTGGDGSTNLTVKLIIPKR